MLSLPLSIAAAEVAARRTGAANGLRGLTPVLRAPVGQRMARIITMRTGEAGDGWLRPMSSYPHDL